MAKDVMYILRDHYSERGGSEDVIEATAKIADLIAAETDRRAVQQWLRENPGWSSNPSIFREKMAEFDAAEARSVAALAACRGLA